MNDHWKIGAGEPDAAAVNVTVAPETTVWLAGWVVNTGGVLTVRVTGGGVALPAALVATTAYEPPLAGWTPPIV